MCHRLTDGWHHVAGGWHHIIIVDGSETSLVDGAESLINEKNRFTTVFAGIMKSTAGEIWVSATS